MPAPSRRPVWRNAPASSPRGPSSLLIRRRRLPDAKSSSRARSHRSRTAIGPTSCPTTAALAREHGAQARFLADSGVDLILAETAQHDSRSRRRAVGREGHRRACDPVPRHGRRGPAALGRVDRGRGSCASAPRARRARHQLCAGRAPRGGPRASGGGRAGRAARGLRQSRTSGRREGLGLHRRGLARGLRRARPPLARPRRPHRRRLLRHDGRAHAGAAQAARRERERGGPKAEESRDPSLRSG